MEADDRQDGRILAVAERYLEMGDGDRVLEQLARLSPEAAYDEQAVVYRVFAHLGRERPQQAVGAARDGLEHTPGSTAILFALSRALEAADDLAGAERAILDALGFDPDDPELLCQYADLVMRAGQLPKAEALIDRAEASRPGSVMVANSRLQLAYLRGDDREVRRRSEELLARDPESVRGQSMLGMLAVSNGSMRDAHERFAGLVAADPRNEALAEAARDTRRYQSGKYLPHRVAARFGVGGTWAMGVGTIFGLRAAGLETASSVAAVLWLTFCVWSWVVR